MIHSNMISNSHAFYEVPLSNTISFVFSSMKAIPRVVDAVVCGAGLPGVAATFFLRRAGTLFVTTD
jgi:hypothetical protein